MPTGSTLPVRLCLRSLMNVSVIAVTSAIGAVEPERGVDAVREQVAGDAAAGDARRRAATARRRPAAGPPRSSSPAGTSRGSGRCGRAGPRRSAAWPASRPARGGSCTRPMLGTPAFSTASTISRASAAFTAERLLAQDHLAGLAPRRSRSRRACRSGWRCRSRRCPCARPASASRSRPTRSPSSRRTPCTALGVARARRP